METRAKRYSEIEDLNLTSVVTGIELFDDLLSNDKGFITPSAILLTGSSGAGKTTLIKFLQKALRNHRTMLFSREMPGAVVKKQTAGIVMGHENGWVIDDLPFEEFMIELDVVMPTVVFVDSLQVVSKEDFPGMGESEATYHVIKTLRAWGKKNNAVIVLVGHVTKDDGFRGDNTIVQMVDAHFEMINDEKAGHRYMRVGQKNRFGDASKKLYYEFDIKNDMIVGFTFFSEDEYSVKGNDLEFSEFIDSVVSKYMSNIDVNLEGYKEFYNELTEETETIYSSDKSDSEITISLIKTLCELFDKYEIK